MTPLNASNDLTTILVSCKLQSLLFLESAACSAATYIYRPPAALETVSLASSESDGTLVTPDLFTHAVAVMAALFVHVVSSTLLLLLLMTGSKHRTDRLGQPASCTTCSRTDKTETCLLVKNSHFTYGHERAGPAILQCM